MPKIVYCRAREVLDSRGNPTLETEVALEDGSWGRAAVPSGASTGASEALELRDGDKNRFSGKGVLKAVKNVNDFIAPPLLSKELDATSQAEIDQFLLELDGTDNKSKLGANAILGVSLAVCKAAAASCQLPLFRYIGGANAKVLPVPLMNLINGGAHADNNLDFQEFMLVPAGASSFKEALRMGAEIFHSLKKLLNQKKLTTAVGDEGGFAPELDSNSQAWEAIIQAGKDAGYKPGEDFYLALDAAASQFFDQSQKKYLLQADGSSFSTLELIAFYEQLITKYPII